jgi:hypothetical protein
MDNRFETTTITPTVVNSGIKDKKCKLIVLHQNICSLRNKITELEVMLSSELKHVDVICLTEYWQSDLNICYTNTGDFKSVSAFCRVVVNMVDLVYT